jgi:hypothetical protein
MLLLDRDQPARMPTNPEQGVIDDARRRQRLRRKRAASVALLARPLIALV